MFFTTDNDDVFAQSYMHNVHFVDIVHRPYSRSSQSRYACGLRSWGFT